MEVADEQYFTIAVVNLSNGQQRPVRVWKMPSGSQMNLLFILCEHVGYNITLDDICHRMKISINALRIYATRLRKLISPEWVISATNNKGMRILYNGPEFTDTEKTRLIIDFTKMNQLVIRAEAD